MKGKRKNEAKVESKKEALNLISVLLFIPGFFLIGLAFGFLLNEIKVASLLGLGLGFVLAAIFKSLKG